MVNENCAPTFNDVVKAKPGESIYSDRGGYKLEGYALYAKDKVRHGERWCVLYGLTRGKSCLMFYAKPNQIQVVKGVV